MSGEKNKIAYESAALNIAASAFLIIIILFSTILITFSKSSDTSKDDGRLTFSGYISINGGEKEIYNKNVAKDLSGICTLTMTGHFTTNIPANAVIYIKSPNLDITFTAGGTEYNLYDGYTSGSAGNVWGFFTSDADIPKTADVVITAVNHYGINVPASYETLFDSMYFDTTGTFQTRRIVEGLPNILYSFIIFSLGIVILIYCVVFRYYRKAFSLLLSLSLFLISSAIWFVIDFDYLSFLLPYGSTLNSADIMSVVLMLAFFAVFVSNNISGKPGRLVALTSVISAVIVVAMFALELFGIRDLYIVLIPFCIHIIAASVIIISASLYSFVKKKKNRALIISLVTLCACTLLDAWFYMTGMIQSTFFVKFGFLAFIIIQITEVTKMAARIIKNGAKADIYKRLAYTDMMTGVSSRVAYDEKIKEIDASLDKFTPFGIIYFDLNNLKDINDSIGHNYGNKIIIDACALLTSVFGSGDFYRVGGDEFVKIIFGDECDSFIENDSKLFDLIDEYNENSSDGVTISIAHGMSFFVPGQDKSFTEVLIRADKRMYANKAKMKNSDT